MQKFPKIWAQKWQKFFLKKINGVNSSNFAKFMEFSAKFVDITKLEKEKEKKTLTPNCNLIFLIGFQHLIIQ